MKQKVCYIVIIGVIFFSGCKPDDVSSLKRRLNLPAEAALYNVPADDTFFVPYGDSIIDNDVATLGRVLFYDTQLSHNNRVSCGTCHKQQHGFSDNVAFSNGFENGLTGRNTQSIGTDKLPTTTLALEEVLRPAWTPQRALPMVEPIIEHSPFAAFRGHHAHT